MEGGYGFLLDLALILLSTKLLGLLTQRFQLPQVVGALLAGLILGPAVLNVIQETEFIKDTAEIGVIVMMFCAGMETDVNELKHSGKAAFIIALIGVIVPILGGFGLAYFFNQPGVIESDATTPVFLQNMFIGVILTATSVSITVETLKELDDVKVFDTYIRVDSGVEWSQDNNPPVMAYKKSSRSAKEYMELTKETDAEKA